MINKYKSYNPLFFSTVLFIFTILGNILNMNLFTWISFIFILAFILKVGVNHYFPIAIFLIVNLRMFDYSGITFISNFSILIIGIIFLYKLKFKIFNISLIFFLVFMLIDLIHLIISFNFIVFLQGLSWNFILFFAISYFLYMKNNLKEAYIISIKYIKAAIIFCFLFFIVYDFLGYNNLDLAGNNLLYISYRFKGFSGDPNYLSLFILISIFANLNYKIFTNENKLNLFDIIYTFIAIYMGLISQSKSFLILLTIFSILLLIYIMIKFNKLGKSKYSLLLGGIIFSIFVILNFDIIDSLINNTLARFSSNQFNLFSEAGLNFITSNRYELQKFYLNEIVRNPVVFLIGKGRFYHDFYNLHLAHNFYIDMFMGWGVPISIMITLIFWRVLYKYFKNIGINFMIPFFILIVGLFSLSAIESDFLPLFLVLCLIFLNPSEVCNEENII